MCFTSERSLAKDSHSHDEWFLAFDFKENHEEESEMMFDKNGRQEKISLHYKNKEKEKVCIKRWNGRDMVGRTC